MTDHIGSGAPTDGANAAWRITADAPPEYGTYTLRFGGGVTQPIPFDATCAEAAAILAAVQSVGADNLQAVAGSASNTLAAGQPLAFVFVGRFAQSPVGDLVLGTNGMAVALTVEQTTAAAAPSPAAQLGDTYADEDTGNGYTYAGSVLEAGWKLTSPPSPSEGGGSASDIDVSPSVADADNVQDALEALASASPVLPYPYKGDWDAETVYAFGDIIRGSDDQYLRNSLVDGNAGNDPTADYTRWGYCSWDPVNPWDIGTTYYLGQLVTSDDSRIYASVDADNMGNVVSGAAHWRQVRGRVVDPISVVFGYDAAYPYDLGALVLDGNEPAYGLYQLNILATLGSPSAGGTGWSLLSRIPAPVPVDFIVRAQATWKDGGTAARQLAFSDVVMHDNSNQQAAASVTTPLVTLAAGEGFTLTMGAPTFSSGSLRARVLVAVSNADGSEKLVIVNEMYPFESAVTTGVDLRDGETVLGDVQSWEVEEQVGTDLAINDVDGRTLYSTAGGQFTAVMAVILSPNSLVA